MTARDFTPTDGQAGDIESIMADIVPKALDVHPSSTGTRRLRERLVDHPAFQSIIAAAKAEARAELRLPEPTWHKGMYGAPDDMYSRIALERWLASEASA